MTPLVSIVIPCFNAAPWLAETLESCFNQTYRNLEIILVDNGSTDDSLRIASHYHDSRLIVTTCVRKGASAARNTGLDRARGDLVQFLDADDLLATDKIEIQVNRLASEPPGTVASSAWARFGSAQYGLESRDAVFKPQPVWRNLRPDEFLIRSWSGGGMMAVFGWLTPMALIRSAGPWNEQLTVNDDGEFFSRVVLAARGIVFCGDAKGYYRTHLTHSLSNRVDRHGIESDFMAVKLIGDRLLAVNDSAEAKRACAAAYQTLIYRHYPYCPELIVRAEQAVARLGGSDLKFPAGPRSRPWVWLCGWKFTRRLQQFRFKLNS